MKSQTIGIVAILAAVVSPLAAKAQDFSADSVTRDASGHTFRGKIYRSGSMVRAESTAPGQAPNDRAIVVIVDTGKQISYTLVPSQKLMMVAHGLGALNKVGIALPINENPCTSMAGGPAPKGASCKKLDEEAVNGRHTTKWTLTDTINGHSETQTVWVDAALHSAVKVQYGALTQELLNVQQGPQPANLFVVPADYRQMDVKGR